MEPNTTSKNLKFLALFIATILASVFIFYISFKGKKKGELINTSEKIISKLETEKAYVETLLSFNYQIAHMNLKGQALGIIDTGGNKKEFPMQQLFTTNKKKKFIIRYSEIGCNTCVNLLFKNRKLLTDVSTKYEVVILVDFQRYENYVVWKRTSEIKDNIFILKANNLVFDRYFKESSYCFILNEDLTTSKFFKPDNMFPTYVDMYTKNILFN